MIESVEETPNEIAEVVEILLDNGAQRVIVEHVTMDDPDEDEHRHDE